MPRLPFANRRRSRTSASDKSRSKKHKSFCRILMAGLETLESRQLLAADLLFADSFESGSSSNDWNGNWVEDSQNDWFRSTQRATEGSRSAEVDGWANNATLKMSNPVDLSSYDSATLTFDWLIENGLDRGEYLALDISSNGGITWNTSVLQLDGNSDPENQWQSETIDLTPYASSNLVIQFRSKVSRSNEDANVDNVRITGEKSGPEFPATISYPDFSDSTGLAMLGDAAIANGNTLRLTPAAGSMEGAAWHAEKQFVSVGWETSFNFNLNENVGDVGGSDGFTFIIQNHAATYLAGGGGTLGYADLPNSLVIEFDTYQNGESSDPSQSHISVHTNGIGPNDRDEAFSLGSFDTPTLMDDASTHDVTIRYMPGTLEVFYDGSPSPVISASVNLDELLDLDAGKAWVGFTGTTGGGYQNHDILDWEYRVLADTSVTVGVTNASVVEGNLGTTDLTFTVVREGDTSGPATVDWFLTSGTATPGVDYTDDSGQVVFAAEETSKQIIVQIKGDTDEEDTETLTVSLGNLTHGILVADQAVGTILNDDTSIAISDVIVTEGDSALGLLGRFVTEGSGGLTRPRLLELGPDGNDDGVKDLYVASADTDEILRYDGATGDFIGPFITGEPQLDNPLGVAFSPVNEDLYVVSGSSVLRFDETGALVDVPVSGLDGPAGISFFESGDKLGDLLIAERNTDRILRYDGANLTEFIAAGSGGLDKPRNAVFGPDGHLYVSSRDTLQVLKYSAADGSPLGVAAEIPLASLAWVDFGGDGLLYATGRDTDVCCDTSLLQIDPVSGSILQTLALGNDGWSFTVGPNNLIYSSGNGFGNFVNLIGASSIASFNVELSIPSAKPVTVDFSTADITATAGGDYAASSGTIVFEAGVTRRSVLVPTINDSLTENDEEFRVGLSNPIGATLVTASAIGTIQDDGDVSNQAPDVDAGADQTLGDNDGTNFETATLVGLANDNDGTIDSVAWTLDGTDLGSTLALTTSLPVGVHTLTFTATDNEGLSSSDTVEVTIVANQAPTADAGSNQTASDSNGDGFELVTLLGTGSDDDGSIASYEWSDGANVIGATASITPVLAVGTHTLTLEVTDNGGATATDTVTVTVEATAVGPNLSHGNISSVDGTWQTVNLGKSYTSMVVVATPRYNDGSGPGVVRVRNATGSSFDVRVDDAGASAFSGGIHYIAVEEGVYDDPGFKLEAVKYDEAQTSGKTGGWGIDTVGYQQSYSSPVVIGQVMSANDEDWSVFWASSASRTSAPTASALNVGKHVAEDTNATRSTETVGYIVVEANASGSIDGVAFAAGVGADTVRGVGNGTYQYNYGTNLGAQTAILSSAGMDGGDGGWAVLRGEDPVPQAGTTINLSIEEDQLRDTERNHTTEQVAYFIIGGPSGEGEASGSRAAIPQITTHDPLDVNGDGHTSPIDALQVVNALNANSIEEGDMALDTNGDGSISPIDALLVINRLNASPADAVSQPSKALAIDTYFGDLDDEEESWFENLQA